MAGDKPHPEQDPAEGSRETVERQLNETSDRTAKKPDGPRDGAGSGEKSTKAKPTA